MKVDAFRSLSLSNGLRIGLTAEGIGLEWLTWLDRVMSLSRMTDAPTTVFMFGDEAFSPGRVVEIENFNGQIIRFRFESDARFHPFELTRDEAQLLGLEYIPLSRSNCGRIVWHRNLILTYRALYRHIVDGGGLPLHAGFTQLDGVGVLISGPRNVGKSTCCQNLPPPWMVHSDDESVAAGDPDSGYRCHPFPTLSRLENGNMEACQVSHSAPVKGVFFIEQGSRDQVEAIDRLQNAALLNDAARQVFGRVTPLLDDEERNRFYRNIFKNACEMAGRIPGYRLRVKYGGRFWEPITNVLETTA